MLYESLLEGMEILTSRFIREGKESWVSRSSLGRIEYVHCGYTRIYECFDIIQRAMPFIRSRIIALSETALSKKAIENWERGLNTSSLPDCSIDVNYLLNHRYYTHIRANLHTRIPIVQHGWLPICEDCTFSPSIGLWKAHCWMH